MREIGLHKGKKLDGAQWYWSSSEYSSYNAYYLGTGYGDVDYTNLKTVSFRVRPILDLS